MGISDLSAAKLCRQLGADVTIYDKKPFTQLKAEAQMMREISVDCIFEFI
jgi:hypothetical protein